MPRKRKDKTPRPPTPEPIRRRIPIIADTGDGTTDGPLWLGRVAATRQWRMDRRNGERDWRRYYRWFEGEYWNDRGPVAGGGLASDNARDTATVNLLGSIALSYCPFLINGDVTFMLKARRAIDTVSAEIQQSLLNYEWGERGMTRQIKRIVNDVVVIGHGIGKTGYTVEVDEARRPDQDGEINYADYVRKDAAWIERVDPLNFLFDPLAKDGSLHTARWTAEIFFQPLADVMANSRYNPEALEMIHAGIYSPATRATFETMIAPDAAGTRALRVSLPEDNLVVLIEIWDKKFRKRLVYADNVPVPLIEEPWPYDYLDNFPYVKIDYIPVPNDPYGMGVMRQAEDQALQLNRIRTAQFNHIRAHGRKFIARTGLDPEELTKFTDGGDGTVVVCEGTEDIKPIPDAPMSQDFQIIEARIANDIQQLTGADALLQGAPLPSRTTAGEVSTRANILRLKAEDRVAAVEEGVTDLATQVLHHLKKNRTIPDVVRIVGAQGEYWREYTSDEIQADVDVKVSYFAAPKSDPAVERQQRLLAAQTTSQIIAAAQQAGQPLAQEINFRELLRFVLESFDERDIGRFFNALNQAKAPLTEGGEGGAVSGVPPGLPPALAGQLAPAQASGEPGPPTAPNEGLSLQDLMQQLQGSALTSGQAR